MNKYYRTTIGIALAAAVLVGCDTSTTPPAGSTTVPAATNQAQPAGTASPEPSYPAPAAPADATPYPAPTTSP